MRPDGREERTAPVFSQADPRLRHNRLTQAACCSKAGAACPAAFGRRPGFVDRRLRDHRRRTASVAGSRSRAPVAASGGLRAGGEGPRTDFGNAAGTSRPRAGLRRLSATDRRATVGASPPGAPPVNTAASTAWTYLIAAGLFEIGWPLGLKWAQQAENGRASAVGIVVAIVAMGVSGYLLYLAQREISLGTSYAVWTGIGAAGTFLIGVVFFGDPNALGRWLGVALIVAGVATLKLAH